MRYYNYIYVLLWISLNLQRHRRGVDDTAVPLPTYRIVYTPFEFIFAGH